MNTLEDIRRDSLKRKIECIPQVVCTVLALAFVWYSYTQLVLTPLATLLTVLKP